MDSFSIDHTLITAPTVRVAKTMHTSHNDVIMIFDLRFCIPNKTIMSAKGLHTLEHLFAKFMRGYLNSNNIKIIDISPMGCRTGFYMSIIGSIKENKVAEAWKASMVDILRIKDQNCITELNIYQCGAYQMHSLKEAKAIASNITKQTINIIYNDQLFLSKEKLQELQSK